MLWNLVLAGAALTWGSEASDWVVDQLADICPCLIAPRHNVAMGACVGCQDTVAPENYSFWDARRYSDPNRRVLQMLNTSEDLREIEDEWARFWFGDEKFWDAHCPFNIPYRTHLTYDRITGGLE